MARYDGARIPTFEEFVAEKIRSGWRPPMPDYAGGGGGVTANDINGQRGPVVTGPPLAPAPSYLPPTALSNPAGGMPVTMPEAQAGYHPLPNLTGMDRPTIPGMLPTSPSIQLPSVGTGYVPPKEPSLAQEDTPENPYINIDKAAADLEVARDWYLADGSAESEAAFKAAQAAYDASVATNQPLAETPGAISTGLDWGKHKVFEGQADYLYKEIVQRREAGQSDREIALAIKDPALTPSMNLPLEVGMNIANVTVPIGPSDSDEDITAFLDGFVDAYEHGFTAYKDVKTQVPILGGISTPSTVKEPVEAWGPGARAAHEYMASKSNIPEKIAGEMLLDPLNLVGLEKPATTALVRVGTRLAEKEAASFAVREVVGPTLKLVGGIAQTPNWALNAIPDKVIAGTFRGIKTGVSAIGGETLVSTWKGSAARRKGYDIVDVVRRYVGEIAKVADEVPPTVVMDTPTPDRPPQQGALYIPERDAFGNIPDSDLPVWEPDPAKRPAWQERLKPPDIEPGMGAADPMPIPFDRINSELVQRRLELRETLDRIEQTADDSIDLPALQEQVAEQEAVVADLEDVVSRIEGTADTVIPDDAASIQDSVDEIADLNTQLGELDPEDFDTRGDYNQEVKDLKQQIKDLTGTKPGEGTTGPKRLTETQAMDRMARGLPIPDEIAPVGWATPAKPAPDYGKLFDPRAGGNRLVDSIDTTPGLRAKIDLAESVKNDIQKNIDDLKASRGIDKETGQYKVDKETAAEIYKQEQELYIEQQLVGIGHVVIDVVPEAIAQKGVGAADNIPISSKRVTFGRTVRKEGETLAESPGKTTPGGHAIDPQGLPGQTTEYVILGGRNKSGTQQTRFIIRDADGTYTVRKTKVKGDPLGTGLSEHDAIMLADQSLAEFPRKARDEAEFTGHLIEKAVYNPGPSGERALNELRNNRIGKNGFTQEHWDYIDSLRAELKFNRTPPQTEEAARAWSATADQVKKLYPPMKGESPEDKLLRNIVSDPTVNSLEQAVARAEVLGVRKFGEAARVYIDHVVAILRKMFDESRRLYAVDPRVSRMITRDFNAKPFTTSSDRRLDDVAETLLDEVWTGPGSYFKDWTARKVIPVVRDVIAKDKATVEGLIANGANPDNLTKAERREIIQSARKDPGKKGKPGKDIGFESQARESTGKESLESILANTENPLTPAGNRVSRKKGPDSGEYTVTGNEGASVKVTKQRNGTFTVVKARTSLTNAVVEMKLTEDAAIRKADELLPAMQKKVTTDSWYNEPNPKLTPDEMVGWYMREYAPIGDIINTSVDDLVASKVGFERALNLDPKMHNQRNLAADFLHLITLRLPRTLLLADPVTAWTYTERNIISNVMLATFNDPVWIFKGDAWRAVTQTYKDSSIDNSVIAEMMGTVRGGKISEELRITIDKSEWDTGAAGTRVARFMDDQAHLGGLRRVASAPFDWKRDIDRRVERAMKVATFAPEFRSRLNVATITLAREMEEYGTRRGISVTEEDMVDLLWSIRDKNGVYGRDEVYDALFYHLLDNGYDPLAARNFAETASRRWTNLGPQIEKDAIRRVNQVFPSSLDETTLDHYARYIALFHFWPTRSTKYVVEQMIRHPQIALTWWKAHEGLERLAEEQGYPSTLQGFIRMLPGPFGYMLYANPAALFMVYALLPDSHTYKERENVTGLGVFLNSVKKLTGLAPLPAIDLGLALVGVYGDANVPDILPSRTIDLIFSGLDAALVAGGHHPHTPVWEQGMENAREFVTSMMPGVNTIDAGNKGGYIEDPIGQLVLKQNPEMWARMNARETYVGPDGTTQTRFTEDAALAYNEFISIMDDEESDAYIAAEKAFAYTNLIVKGGINTWFPLSARAVDEDRAFTLELKASGQEKLDAGETPTVEEQSAMNTRAIVADSPESRELKGQSATVDAYGTTEQVTLNDGYQLIRYGKVETWQELRINGKAYAWHELANMGDDGRAQLADEWLLSQSGLEQYSAYTEGKKALTDTLPVLKDYKSWTNNFRNEDGSFNEGYRERYIEQSPGYAGYIAQLPDEITSDPERFNQLSVSKDAYLAASGKSTSVYDKPYGDASDISTFRPDEIMGGGSSSGGSSSSSKSDYESATKRLERLNKSITKYETDMAKIDARVKEITGGMGYEEFKANHHPGWVNSLEKQLEREGVKVPSQPDIIKSYMDWAAAQGPGKDTSKVSYIEWVMTMEPEETAA